MVFGGSAGNRVFKGNGGGLLAQGFRDTCGLLSGSVAYDGSFQLAIDAFSMGLPAFTSSGEQFSE
jgi:hypothetical protein